MEIFSGKARETFFASFPNSAPWQVSAHALMAPGALTNGVIPWDSLH